ncbi:MAG: carbamoyltransferase [Candidatus Aenigmatarchaeota archaeon]
MTYILGLSAFYHDSAATLIKGGKVIAAAEEERFSRIKHDNSFPINAINYCLSEANIDINKIKYIAYYEKPLVKFDRVVHMFLNTYPFSFITFWKSFPAMVTEKLNIKSIIRKKLKFNGKILFIPHHESHAASAFFPSPFSKAAIFTVDGVGEWQTTGLYLGIGNHIIPLKIINFPNSLGLLYSTITAFLGFKVNEDEYKVMGLSAYGKPIYYKKFLKLVKINEDGSFTLNMEYFSFIESFKMWSKKMEKLFGKPRKPMEKIKKRHANIASSLQKITEEIYLKVLNHLYKLTKVKNLCIAGGVALNALANGKIYEETPFRKVFIQGAAGDNGASLGAAFFVYNFLLKQKRNFVQNHLYFGPSFSNDYIEKFLKEIKADYEYLNDKELVKRIAELLSRNNVVGWFRGRMEFGPRALGARSILANPKPKWMKDRVNEIKRRESFRPFAGSFLQEYVHEYFEVPEENHYSPFMIFAFKVKKEKAKYIRAIVHANNTCRIQTVNRRDNGIYYDLIKEFYKITKIPGILNTSFNLKGEPIVCKPEEAYYDFIKTSMDFLVLNNYIVYKLCP